ncbi:MAG: hypothetical protein ACXVPN_12060 [Bacteroidia bacterium]
MEKKKKAAKKKNNLKGYPHYPESEDIYSREKEEADLDPENPKKVKAHNEKLSELNEKNFPDDVSGGDLDVPEQNESQINLVNEDEENDYYSIGGDNHLDLEENTED